MKKVSVGGVAFENGEGETFFRKGIRFLGLPGGLTLDGHYYLPNYYLLVRGGVTS